MAKNDENHACGVAPRFHSTLSLQPRTRLTLYMKLILVCLL